MYGSMSMQEERVEGVARPIAVRRAGYGIVVWRHRSGPLEKQEARK
ncbi:MAG: hypothetical protein GY832_24545 [Chloroflexi bacterium]|nr:hypothetical protein [Chloroflexota bacterium]